MNNNSTDNINDNDIDELLQLQEEFISKKKQPAASCIKPKKKADKTSCTEKKNVTFSVCKLNNIY